MAARNLNSLRIASLLPSTTDIVASLGLSRNLVGVTHECQIPSNCAPGYPHILTSSLLDYEGGSQKDIDDKVKAAANEAACALPSNSAGDIADKVQSLYPIDRDALRKANPNVVLTQNLCGVCAPSTSQVRQALNSTREQETTDSRDEVKILSLEPQSLQDVADTFVTIAEACGVRERGVVMREQFLSNLQLLEDTVTQAAKGGDGNTKRPRVLLLEWLDPPYDGGHWIPDMIARAGCDFVTLSSSSSAPAGSSWDGTKSKQVTWDDIYDADPDVILVANCGFDLQRNVKDAMGASKQLAKLRAAKEGRVYACNGDVYFARPGPLLLKGANIAAQCAFEGVDDDEVTAAVQALDFAVQEGKGWAKVDVLQSSTAPTSTSSDIDIEDIIAQNESACWAKVHDEAVARGEMDYIDPATGYHVFTELAHRKRGKCCGSGCRHCPFSHANVKPELKAERISQPAFLYEREDKSGFVIPENAKNGVDPKDIKILFWSGGKDSFLALRALVRQGLAGEKAFGIVLLTTFDASSRIIAHQEVHIANVVRQATALGIPLVGVPMHRGTSESYVDRVRRGVEVISSSVIGKNKKITLAFGDLHLAHIKEWRDSALDCYNLEYPNWKVKYEDLLQDLDRSGVPCIVSASSNDIVKEGEVFGRDLYDRAIEDGVDAFGEEGEFHSLAQVWEIDRRQALGLA